MIAAIGLAFSKFGNWAVTNPAAKWIIGAVIFIICWILYGERRENQGENKQKQKQKVKDVELRERATESANEIIEEEETDADQAIDAGKRAVRSEPGPLERMSDEEWRLTFGRDRAPGDAGYRSKG